jgi:hypothetical protein
MLHKNVQKSNLLELADLIGILQGKKANYNYAILETLFKSGCLTAGAIGRKIASRKYSGWELEAKAPNVYSVIQRKKGRIKELEVKGYVRAKGGKYELTLKGAATVLLLKPTLISQMNPYYSNVSFALCKDVEPNALDKITPQLLSDLAQKTRKCLNEGMLNLDRISADRFMVIIELLAREDIFNE